MTHGWRCYSTWGLMLCVASLTYLTYLDYQTFLKTPLSVPANGQVFVIPVGTGITQLAQALPQQSIIWQWRTRLYLEVYARGHQLAARLKTGEYLLAPGTTPPAFIAQIVAGRVIQYPLTVIEGWTFQQLRQAIAMHPKIVQTLQGANDADIMMQLGRPGDHPEGRFFPDTYRFPTGTTDVAFLKRALTTMDRQLADCWRDRDPRLTLSDPYQALILASIIEKETAQAAERAEIAGVFLRRLQIGMPLQTDPTVIYGLADRFDGRLRKQDLITDTPYNTYTRKGLPPTPIALPGAAALHAAVHPALGEALYFVANGQGAHVFSKTLDAHQRAVKLFQH